MYGVREVVISLGLCLMLFVFVFEVYLNIKIWIYFDEWSVVFFVVGLIKGSERFVVILCMLGIVVVNYMFVIVES